MSDLLDRTLGERVHVEVDLLLEVWPIYVDPHQLENAIVNLAVNARDALEGEGLMRIAARNVTLAANEVGDVRAGEYVELCISDTGQGMPPEVIERAFEPFFTTKEVGKGTGLGLSMVYGMARQSGGAARIESTPGKGTNVRLLFRSADRALDEVKTAGNEDSAAPAVQPAPTSVLVIDDDPDVREFIAAALEEQGYRVRQASDGREGLAELARKSADLIVIDFIMPGISGAEVASRIRADKPEQPILFVSGYSETDAVKRAAPDAPLLAKPFRAEALHKAVRSALAARA
jgi:CheY-like chemotaxis protein